MKFQREAQSPTFATEALHIVGLWGLAFAQPLYQTLGDGAAFFSAHGATPSQLLAFVGCLSFALPLGLVGIKALVHMLTPRLGRGFHVFLVWMLVLAFASPLIGRAGLSLVPHLALAGLTSIGIVLGLAVSPAARSFMSVFSWSALVFPVLFLARPEIRTQVFARSNFSSIAVSNSRPIPVSILVFDELSLVSLLNDDGEIDGERYPNFGRLAAISHWFRNATAVAEQTVRAIPAIATGSRPPIEDKAPVANDFPQNIFTLLARTHSLHVSESITRLCPRPLCRTDASNASSASIANDATIVTLHRLLPKELTPNLPSIAENWANFGAASALDPDKDLRDQGKVAARFHSLLTADRLAAFRQFVSRMGDAAKPPLNFVHTLLPHAQYEFTEGARRYVPQPLGVYAEQWLAHRHATQQRYLLQLQTIDQMLGEYLDQLAKTGLLERSLLVVMSDHGVSFEPQESRRLIGSANVVDIAAIPLFIKRPGQLTGDISDVNVETIDVLPTIADVLGVPLAEKVDGRSVFDESQAPRASKSIYRFVTKTFEEYPSRFDLRSPTKAYLDQFGQGKRLEPIYLTRDFESLAGTPVSNIPSLATSSVPEVNIFGREHLQNVALNGPILPLNFGGVVRNLVAEGEQHVLAAVNGIVATVSPLSTENGRITFQVLVPPHLLREGQNELDVFVLQRSPSGAWGLLGQSRTAMPVSASSLVPRHAPLHVMIDSIEPLEQEVIVRGWSADVPERKPAERILLFVDDTFAGGTLVGTRRTDVAQHFNADNLALSGFQFSVPKEVLRRRTPRLYAVDASGATEIPLSSDTRCQLERLAMGKGNVSVALPVATVADRMDNDVKMLTGFDDKTFSVEPPRLVGVLEQFEWTEGCIRVRGWSQDVGIGARTELLLVVQQGHVVAHFAPGDARPDVIAAFGTPSHHRPGFDAIIASEDFADGALLRFYAVTSEQTAAELSYDLPTASAAP